jgi:hypothetical protein
MVAEKIMGRLSLVASLYQEELDRQKAEKCPKETINALLATLNDASKTT